MPLLPWFVIPVVLCIAPVVLFAGFTTWLTRTLEGYPMFLIQHGDRGTGVVPVLSASRSVPRGP